MRTRKRIEAVILSLLLMIAMLPSSPRSVSGMIRGGARIYRVETGPISVATTDLAVSAIVENYGYHFSNDRARKELREFMTNTVSGSSLGKTVDPANASLFYFEKENQEDTTYWIYTYVEGVKKYVTFSLFGGDKEFNMVLADTPEADQKVSISTVNGDTVYRYISYKNININKHSNLNGVKFGGWHQKDEGSRIYVSDPTILDPLLLEGKDLNIISGGNLAINAEEVTPSGGATGLKAVGASLQDGAYQATDDGVELTKWKFTGLGDGYYYISTDTDSGRKYINVSARTSTGQTASVTLGDAPQKLSVIPQTDGTITIFSIAERLCTRLNLTDGNNTQNRRLAGNGAVNASSTQTQKFTLSVATPDNVVYEYPAYSGPWPAGEEDTGTPHTPTMMDEQWEDATAAYTLKEPSATTYVSKSAGYNWNYAFAGWKIAGEDTVYQPGDTLPVDRYPGEEGTLTLEAVWTYTGRDVRQYTVNYVLNMTDDQFGTAPEVAGTEGNPETVSGAAAGSYALRSLTYDIYTTLADVSDKAAGVKEFQGWMPEGSSTTLTPGTVLDLSQETDTIPVYDPNMDDVITFTAKWGDPTTYTGSNLPRKVLFSVLKKASPADMFTSDVFISTNPVDFVTGVFMSTMVPSDMEAPPVYSSNDKYSLTNYVKGSSDPDAASIVKQDALTRKLDPSSTGLEKDGVTYKLGGTFPSDEQVFAAMRRMGANPVIEGSNTTVPLDELTVENYTIRWYVCKYQNDGWHVDGKITPRVSYVTVQKTIAGDSAAVQKVTTEMNGHDPSKDYYIELNNSSDTANSYKLFLESGVSNKKQYGLISGEQTNGSFGYIEKNGNTYTWVLPTARGGSFEIMEYNYNVTIGEIVYGIAAQYSIVHSQDGNLSVDVPPTQWFGTVSGYSATYPAGIMDIGTMQTVKLSDTYVETGTLLIEKRDQGSAYAPMPNVSFQVYEIDPDTGNATLLGLSRREGAATDDGHYTVLYENGSSSTTGETGSDGNLYLSLQKPTEDDEWLRYRVDEIVPPGYLVSETNPVTPTFTVEINNKGEFRMVGDPIPPESGSITPISLADPSGAGTPLLTGVVILNEPVRLIDVTVQKSWADGSTPEASVEIRLTGTISGTTLVDETVKLSAANSWKYSWTDLPLVSANRLVDYEVTETEIGNNEEGTAGYYAWIPTYAPEEYYDKDMTYLGNQNTIANEDIYKVRKIDFAVLNSPRPEITSTHKLTITRSEGTTDQDFWYSVFETTQSLSVEVCIPAGTDSVTIAGLPAGTYSVYERTEWSWRYDCDSENHMQSVTMEEGTEAYTLTFSGDKINNYWSSGNNRSVNDFKHTD